MPGDPCQPSPCGPYSNCRVIDNHAVCSCQPNYVGNPPQCRPECVVSTDCTQNTACIDQKCKDPCPGTCGQNADCQVINHNPVCSCTSGYTGDPFFGCVKERKIFIFVLFIVNDIYIFFWLKYFLKRKESNLDRNRVAIHAFHHRVDRILSVAWSMVSQRVLVYRIMWAEHRIVDRNVSSTKHVLEILPVRMNSAWILAQVLVEWTLIVTS